MIALSHLIALLVFILIGGLGMAALQDGGTLVWKRMAMLLGKARRAPETRQPMLSPLTFGR